MGGTDGDTTSHCGPGVHSILDVIKGKGFEGKYYF